MKGSIITICVFLIASGFLLKLFPKSKLDNSVKILLSVLTLIMIISPLFKSIAVKKPEISFRENINKEKAEKYYKSYVGEKTLEKYLQSIREHLKSKGISFEAIESEYEITDSAIELKYIVAICKNEKEGEIAKQEIEKQFGVKARFYV